MSVSTERDLVDFATELQQEVLATAELEDVEAFQAEVFTQRMIQELTESGELEDGTVCYHRSRGTEISGYSVAGEDETLDLFITIFNQTVPPTTVPKTEVIAAFKRLLGFLQKASTDYFKHVEEASPVFDMAKTIRDVCYKVNRIRLFLFTDGIAANLTKTQRLSFRDMDVSLNVWDIIRLQRHVNSGRVKEPIVIDFIELFGLPVPCLRAPEGASEYDAYLAILHGTVLNKIYSEFGSRLLERNVRSFLQAKGKVNQGIIRTIREQPGRFLPYNNGLSATASGIELVTLAEGGVAIKSIDDFQIVNGGQTTASIHFAARNKVSVEQIYVQAKITVVPPSDVDEIVPLISRFANSQNKISDADFSANDPFHVTLEGYSRSVWAPAPLGTQRQTKWFYERARGQYMDAIRREGTTAKQQQFKMIYPNSQKFGKTDVAKYESSWSQMPHTVSLGAQKCFANFMLRLSEMENSKAIDQKYFENLIAKAILFHRTEAIVKDMKFGGYRANIVTYTIAFISMQTAQRIDLEKIWQQQTISPALGDYIEKVASKVHHVLIDAPGTGNVTEWAKKLACWDKVKTLEIPISAALEGELAKFKQGESKPVRLVSKAADSEIQHLKELVSIGSVGWQQLAQWAMETGHLDGYRRGVATSIGNLISQGVMPSAKQAQQGVGILREAQESGFEVVLDADQVGTR